MLTIMKRRGFVYLLLVLSAVLIATPGCTKKPKGVTPIHGSATRTGPGNNAMPIMDPGATLGGNNNGVAVDPNREGIPQSRSDIEGRPKDREMFKAHTVYFALDSANIRPSERPNLEAVANYLKANPNADILVEGHCDERGTEGYNLALGDRRALSAREYLVNSGVPADRLHTISFGESRPAVDEHNEAAWSKNRRAEFVLVMPAQ